MSTIPYSEFTLERFKYATQWIVSKTLLQGYAKQKATYSEEDDLMMNAMKMTFHTEFMGLVADQQEKTVNVSWPAGPWQFFKHRYFPRWFLRRWPVKWERHTETVKFVARILYPDAPEMLGRRVVKTDVTSLMQRLDA